ncbi:hypothetical protein CFN58_07655 [Pseudomonas avellanae]|uniref:Uncharacterized protein n=1 Tax=Pseudomonas avellanae TaxID=46257 RepID=A0A261WLS6_9PSED|nr:hypothetical protein CFN58_07655 [Pseudomonas avellanae]
MKPLTDVNKAPSEHTVRIPALEVMGMPVFSGHDRLITMIYPQSCGFHGHPATHSMNIRPLIPR